MCVCVFVLPAFLQVLNAMCELVAVRVSAQAPHTPSGAFASPPCFPCFPSQEKATNSVEDVKAQEKAHHVSVFFFFFFFFFFSDTLFNRRANKKRKRHNPRHQQTNQQTNQAHKTNQAHQTNQQQTNKPRLLCVNVFVLLCANSPAPHFSAAREPAQAGG